jgi:hypothetical protein
MRASVIGVVDHDRMAWTRFKDGREWQVADESAVAWIAAGTKVGLTITSAIPPVFAAYATVVVPDGVDVQERSNKALLDVLQAYSTDRSWWLGYLHTSFFDEMPFNDVPRVRLYAKWEYTLVLAGAEQAATWRTTDDAHPGRGALPELMFPTDRSWLVSTLWDDDWRCIGGPADLVAAVLAHPHLDAHPVDLGQDATPPGHQAW